MSNSGDVSQNKTLVLYKTIDLSQKIDFYESFPIEFVSLVSLKKSKHQFLEVVW